MLSLSRKDNASVATVAFWVRALALVPLALGLMQGRLVLILAGISLVLACTVVRLFIVMHRLPRTNLRK
jgi:hypothetical protein